LFKGEVRASDWSKFLDFNQIHYAATDAYAGFRIWDALECKRKMINPPLPLPQFCDHDEKSRQSTKRVKAVRKPAVITTGEEATAVVDEPSEEEDADEYETAAEELMDSHELEDASDSESSAHSDDPDADYLPRTRRVGRLAIDQDQQDSGAIGRSIPTRRVGRVNFSRLSDPDPGYPTLPSVSSDEGDDSDSSSAFDPPSKTRLRRRAVENTSTEEPLLEVSDRTEIDEFEDKELDHLLSSMDIDEMLDDKNDKPSVAYALKDGLEQTPHSLTPDPTTETNDEGQRSADTISIGNTSKDEKKKEKSKEPSSAPSKATMSVSAPLQPQDPDSTPAPTPTFAPLQPDTTPRSSEYIAAETWAQDYLYRTIPSPSASSTSTSRIRTTVPHIRAYHLWHHQHLPLDVVATHLRDPPLAQSTVASYILQAVTLEKLEYRSDELKEVLRGLPIGLRMGRWRYLVERLGGLD